jgi:hypothetical protein
MIHNPYIASVNLLFKVSGLMFEVQFAALKQKPKITKKYLHQTWENKPSLNDINEAATESRTSTVARRQSEDEACPKSNKSSSNG